MSDQHDELVAAFERMLMEVAHANSLPVATCNEMMDLVYAHRNDEAMTEAFLGKMQHELQHGFGRGVPWRQAVHVMTFSVLRSNLNGIGSLRKSSLEPDKPTAMVLCWLACLGPQKPRPFRRLLKDDYGLELTAAQLLDYLDVLEAMELRHRRPEGLLHHAEGRRGGAEAVEGVELPPRALRCAVGLCPKATLSKLKLIT
jgi:hypothetical protein